jgi:tRNA threonylcarbamoyladenosine biosynthesis protein TsaE
MPVSVVLPDVAATSALGARLATACCGGRVLFLRGPLGAGKTTLVRGILRELGYTGRVKSPTYTLLELYVISRLDFYHFDLYRITHHQELFDAGFEEYFNGQSVCVLEWPERAQAVLPPPDLDISLELAAAGRVAQIRSGTPAGEAWLISAFPNGDAGA